MVAGAASGIGRAVVLGFLAEGAEVLGFDADADGLAALAGSPGAQGAQGRLLTVHGDVSHESDTVVVAAEAARAWGGLDVLVNSAGVYWRGKGEGPVDGLELSVWNHVLTIKATGTFLICKPAVPLLSSTGSIINDASLGGVVCSPCHAYATSKGAVPALTSSLASSYAARGIRANAIAPGVVETPMSVAVTGDQALQSGSATACRSAALQSPTTSPRWPSSSPPRSRRT